MSGEAPKRFFGAQGPARLPPPASLSPQQAGHTGVRWRISHPGAGPPATSTGQLAQGQVRQLALHLFSTVTGHVRSRLGSGVLDPARRQISWVRTSARSDRWKTSLARYFAQQFLPKPRFSRSAVDQVRTAPFQLALYSSFPAVDYVGVKQAVFFPLRYVLAFPLLVLSAGGPPCGLRHEVHALSGAGAAPNLRATA